MQMLSLVWTRNYESSLHGLIYSCFIRLACIPDREVEQCRGPAASSKPWCSIQLDSQKEAKHFTLMQYTTDYIGCLDSVECGTVECSHASGEWNSETGKWELVLQPIQLTSWNY